MLAGTHHSDLALREKAAEWLESEGWRPVPEPAEPHATSR